MIVRGSGDCLVNVSLGERLLNVRLTSGLDIGGHETCVFQKNLITFPSRTPKTGSVVFAVGHPSFYPTDQCYSSQQLDLNLEMG